jgi:hypothetical protein
MAWAVAATACRSSLLNGRYEARPTPGDERVLLVEISPCGYAAKCSVPWCRKCAIKTVRHLDKQCRAYRKVDVCKNHARELFFEMKVVDKEE